MIGNVSVLTLVHKSLSVGSFPQLSLISGACGTGKSTLAEQIGLSLVCERPDNGNYCGNCKSCEENIAALATGGSAHTSSFQKYNMARIAAEGGVRKFVHDTFDLSHTTGRLVRILEEFHQVFHDEQRIFLEETARLSRTVYLILVASDESAVDKAVRSRCTKFRMSTLQYSDSVLLMDTYSNGRQLPDDILRTIHRECAGVPRDMIEQVKFFINSGATDTEIREYIVPAKDTVYEKLFAQVKDFSQYISIVEKDILAQNDNPLPRLRKYLASIAVELELDEPVNGSGLTLAVVSNIFKMLDSVSGDASPLEVFIRLRWMVAHAVKKETVPDTRGTNVTSSVKVSGNTVQPNAKTKLVRR